MTSELEFIHHRLKIVEEYLQDGPPELLAKQRQYDHVKNAIEKNRYELEARLLHHILTVATEGQVLYALTQWSTKFRAMFEQHYAKNRELFYEYELWHQLSNRERNFVPKPPPPPSLRYFDQHHEEWVIDEEFLKILTHLRQSLSIWLSTS